MTTIANFDIDELVIQLHEELKLAFHMAQVDDLSDRYQIESVKAKIGRKDLGTSENEINHNVLNPVRYPDEEDWEIEVSYSKKDRNSLNQSINVRVSNSLLLDKLKYLPLSSLKGISAFWEKVFSDQKIQTIGELVKLTEAEIHRICNNQNSFLPLEFQTKAMLLNQPVTLAKKPDFKALLLDAIALKSEDELIEMFENRLTRIEVRELRAISNLLMMVLDKDIYLKLSLDMLF